MRKLEMKDFLQYRFLSGLELSPDGRHAAFVVSAADGDANGYKSDIRVMEVATRAIRRLTAMGDAKSFLWTGDNELIFPALREEKDKERAAKGEKLTVYQKIRLDGGEAAECFRAPYAIGGIRALGDGRFAVVCGWHPDDPDFSSLDDAGRAAALERIAAEKDYEVLDEIPFWRNGEGFTNKARNRLAVWDTATGDFTFVTDELTNVGGFKAQGGKIAYVATRFKDKYDLSSGAYVYDAATRETLTLCPASADGLRVEFIDFWEGGYLLYGTDGKRYGLNECGDFYVWREGELSLLCETDEPLGGMTNSDCRYGGGTAVRVRGGFVYYATVDHVENALRRIGPDGAVETILKQSGTFDGFDVGEGGILWFGLGATTLHEVYALEGGEPVRLSDFNGPFLKDILLNAPERCDARGAWDTVEGFVLKPIGFDPAKTYPAILHIHGGPKTAFGDTYFHEAHLWSARGYFVLFCNPWGSDGRGDRFADLRGRYGTVDYDDLMAFTDQCLTSHPQIDAGRLAVGGGSYGGFMTNWIIGHTDRFCCAASQRSIANWISKTGTTDIGYYFNTDQQASTPWDDPEKMWWHSPMKYADRVKTPTLFIHSEEDYRCWLAEGLQMFTSLKYHGVEARLCMFRGENHELSRSGKPKHRARRMEEILSWFDRFCSKGAD